MNREYTPIEIGLDALEIQPDACPAVTFEIQGNELKDQVAVVSERIEQTMRVYPEIRVEILAAGMKVLLGLSCTLDDLKTAILPRLDRSVDNAAL